ncbi:MAG TPA: hypothetical protein VD970_00350 [Acetobacteraceae bacterium]|nr:hypothetical protein [Acetobacteraceae bacterium]
MRIDWFGPWTGAVLGFVIGLLAALLLRAMRRPVLAGIAAPLGLCAAWITTLGLVTASPRQLAERLPLLALGALLLGLPAAAARPVLLWPLVAIGAAGAGWWMGGAPLTAADLGRAALVIGVVAAGTVLAFLLMGEAWQALAGSLALAAAFAVAPLPGPQLALALGLAAAVAGAWIGGAASGAGLALPLAMALASLAALPPLARGATADWLVVAAPAAALLLGPLAARRMPPEAAHVLAALLAALPVVLAIAWLAGRLG